MTINETISEVLRLDEEPEESAWDLIEQHAYYRTAAPALAREVQRLQGEVERLQEEWLTAYADGIKNGFQSGAESGQEAMREKCAARVDRAANEACECDGTLCGPDDVQRRVRELRERIAEERRAR